MRVHTANLNRENTGMTSCELCSPHSPSFILLIDFSNSLKALFEEHGGDMPAKSTQVSEEWAKKTNGEVYTPFPYYFTGWINLPPHDGQRVICIPHKDWKNVAAFWCAVFCFSTRIFYSLYLL